LSSVIPKEGKDRTDAVFTQSQVFLHAEQIRDRYIEKPLFAVNYLNELLISNNYQQSSHPDIIATYRIIDQLKRKSTEVKDDESVPSPPPEDQTTEIQEVGKDGEEKDLRNEIVQYYLPKQLVNAIMEIGGIPPDSIETQIGIAFLDIADYTYLSKFLSSKENQDVLNGLYTAFNFVLKRHGGYLNKIEGDSIMFQFGGLIDPNTKGKSDKEALEYIARELFYSCVEMQRVCILFNQANDSFIKDSDDEEAKRAIHRAYEIINFMRGNTDLSPTINALFQIRIRIGANIGNVMIGNFGPDGAKHWDVIGSPVIEAKRMESTAPIGGLRISEAFHDILNQNDIVNSYFNRFKREAKALVGEYAHISLEDLFKLSRVILKDKKDAEFVTYSVQVNPGLPEDITRQVELLLQKDEYGADRIISMMQYYRGNRYVIDALEKLFDRLGILLRKPQMFKGMYPQHYKKLVVKLNNNRKAIDNYIQDKYSLYDIFRAFGDYQDQIKFEKELDLLPVGFESYDQFMESEESRVNANFRFKIKSIIRKSHFFHVIFPLVFKIIRTSLLEFQYMQESTAQIMEETLEVVDEEMDELEELTIQEETGETVAAPPEDLDEIGDLEEVGEIEELEELEEPSGPEALNDSETAVVEELEEVSSLEEISELDEVEEFDDVGDLEELGELEELEDTAEIAELKELSGKKDDGSDLGKPVEVELVEDEGEELDELEEVGEPQQEEIVDGVEELEELEELEEIQDETEITPAAEEKPESARPMLPVEVEDVEELDDTGEMEELEELEEFEELEEVDSSPQTAAAELKPVEVEEISDLDEIGELEELEELEEVPDT
jgi:adenylate cyclase